MQFQGRLTDPMGIVSPEKLKQLNDKLSACMTRMFRLPKHGGNPFLFALTQGKSHELRHELPGMPKDDRGIPTFQTAATDGKRFYWSPTFLEKLNNDETTVVMQHESYHIVFYHPQRGRGLTPEIYNWMADYSVNAGIEHDHVQTGRQGALWGGNLGIPLPMKELLDYIDGVVEMPKGKFRIYADINMYGRSPESMYNEVLEHWEKSPRKCTECSALTIDPKTGKSKVPKPWAPETCIKCGAKIKDGSGMGYAPDLPSSTDAHIDPAISRDEVLAETEKAAQVGRSMRGTVPACIEDALGELHSPTLSMHDLIRNARFRRVQTSGNINDWRRLRRRPLALQPRLYLPMRMGCAARWIAMLDTSGSMGDDDMRYGVSQLQVAGNESEGIVVPVDATPHWEAATPVKNLMDLKRTRVVGRGGTVFEQFFSELPERLGTDWDCLIIITDGDCGTIPLELRPPMDVVWVLTRHLENFEPTFGRVAPLRNERM